MGEEKGADYGARRLDCRPCAGSRPWRGALPGRAARPGSGRRAPPARPTRSGPPRRPGRQPADHRTLRTRPGLGVPVRRGTDGGRRARHARDPEARLGRDQAATAGGWCGRRRADAACGLRERGRSGPRGHQLRAHRLGPEGGHRPWGVDYNGLGGDRHQVIWPAYAEVPAERCPADLGEPHLGADGLAVVEPGMELRHRPHARQTGDERGPIEAPQQPPTRRPQAGGLKPQICSARAHAELTLAEVVGAARRDPAVTPVARSRVTSVNPENFIISRHTAASRSA